MSRTWKTNYKANNYGCKNGRAKCWLCTREEWNNWKLETCVKVSDDDGVLDDTEDDDWETIYGSDEEGWRNKRVIQEFLEEG